MNVFHSIPSNFKEELFEELLSTQDIRVEKIVSKGHTSPKTGWYDQTENEWILILEGSGKILFDDGREVLLSKGDYLNIPKHTKHKVTWTEPNTPTIWLAIFYK